jgi:hypothetical protein
MSTLLEGRLVRLARGYTPDQHTALWARWNRDAQFKRLLDSEPPRLYSEAQLRKDAEEELPDNKGFGFDVRTLTEDRLIGFTYLGIASWVHRDAWLAIGLGDRDHQGKGYGTDALRITLRYAFEELDLHRVTLNVFANNARAMRSYEKAGFRSEGRLREAMLRDGRRIDIVYMGILKEEFSVLSAQS